VELLSSKERVDTALKKVKVIPDSIRLKPEGEIVWVELDLPGEKANKFSSGVLLRLRQIIAELGKSTYKAAIFVSRKNNIFIAGADIEEIKGLKTAQEAEDACNIGQTIYNELENLQIPIIAAIHGACVGGGCEFVLACDYRICTNDPSTKIGLPEVNLGVIPGFGGTQRLPRVIGLQNSLDIILAGKTVPGAKALKSGLVDQCVPKEILEEIARKVAKEAIEKGKRQKRFKPQGFMNVLLENPLGNQVVFHQARKALLAQTKGNYPAPEKALEVVKKTYGMKLEKGLKIERQAFGEMAITDVSKNLINLFFMTEMVKKSTGVSGNVTPHKVEAVAVLGAGTMGGGIAQLAAEKEISVRLKDVNFEAIGKGLRAAQDIFSKALKRKKINSYEMKRKMALISGSTDYSGFKSEDVVIEAIVEDINVKRKVLAETASHCKEDVILASNTSSLSITEIGRDLPKPENFVGMHFFNPVHRMPLIEVIRGEKTNDEAAATIYALSKKLGKTPIVVKDGPGFLVNRLLMPYLNESVFILADGNSIEYIDKSLLKFGMPMGPLLLIDEIGIDVAVKVAKILGAGLGSRAEPSPLMSKVVDTKRFGKKNKKGFYKYDANGRSTGVDSTVYAELGLGSPKNNLNEEQLVHRALFPMINEAALCVEEKIVESPEMVDLGMIMGTGFPPFRGGLLRWADSLGAQKIVDELEIMVGKYGLRFKPSAPLRNRAKNNLKFYGK